jgi:uncharacterized protein DUF1549/uncharacterized protein DUF1553
MVLAGLVVASLPPSSARATPANKAALERHYDKSLAKDLARCTTCHLPSENKNPESLDEFPHNPFGNRLRALGKELAKKGERRDIPARLKIIDKEDSDGDGVDNETELLLGHNPGDASDTPTKQELATAKKRRAEFRTFLSSYRWQPFETVNRPSVPNPRPSERREGRVRGSPQDFKIRNPIDAFVATEHQARGLVPRPEAPKHILLRRVYLDLIGLSPTPEELEAFEKDTSPDAYERVVDRLLDDPRYGERWGRHWMDVWRYSDWAGWSGGNQIRDSKPHIWRWRDWIVESLNQDKGYNRMILEMLAADELAPDDTDALRATGYLVRNYKMLSREQWLEDTIKHTSQAFLAITMGCAKCHNHMVDPISQKEYYQLRAIFEPHQVRTDRVPGQTDTALDGLVRVFDTATNATTYFFIRGDERKPDTNRIMAPDVPQVLGGRLIVEPVALPRFAAFPDKREFVVNDSLAASQKALTDAREKWAKEKTNSTAKPEKLKEQELNVAIAEARHTSLLASVRAEKLQDDGQKDSEEWKEAATEAAAAQRQLAMLEAKLKLHLAQVAQAAAQSKADDAAKAVETSASEATDKLTPKKTAAEKATKDLGAAKKKTADAEKAYADAEKELQAAPTTAYKPRPMETYPATSTGRRLAFARWIADRNNPLTARVAANHIWLRHFGRGIVPTTADFGRNGRPPSHPQLLDWLAAELMEPSVAVEAFKSSSVKAGTASPLRRLSPSTLQRPASWSMKHLHRLIVTSSTYRMASTPDEANAKIDPDNIYLWRMNSRRMEAEVVRDNLLYVSGDLEAAMGGPDIDHKLGLTSKRRSIYLRIAAEKEVEFLKIFDGPSVTECYERRPSVMPQQALALANSELALREARVLARGLQSSANVLPAQPGNDAFVTAAFLRILARTPTHEELRLCGEFLEQQNRSASPVSLGASGLDDNNRSHDKPWRAMENLVLVLFNHNDFVTIR